MTTNQTSELLSSIYEDLRRGVSSWEVWKEINSQLSRSPTGHFEFFEPVLVAILDSVLLAITRVLDEDRRARSIPNLMATETALRQSKLEGDVDDLLLNYKATLKKILQRRNQYIAHRQRSNQRSSHSQISVADIDTLITSIVDIFRKLGGFLQSADYDFDHVREGRKRETAKVMKILREDWENRRPGNRRQLTG